MRCLLCGRVVGGKNKAHCWTKQHCGNCHYLQLRVVGVKKWDFQYAMNVVDQLNNMVLEVDQKFTVLLNVTRLVNQDQQSRGVKMPCRSMCNRYLKTVSQRMIYTSDKKHCTVCAMWVPSDTLRCPCCSHILRTKKRLNYWTRLIKSRTSRKNCQESLGQNAIFVKLREQNEDSHFIIDGIFKMILFIHSSQRTLLGL